MFLIFTRSLLAKAKRIHIEWISKIENLMLLDVISRYSCRHLPAGNYFSARYVFCSKILSFILSSIKSNQEWDSLSDQGLLTPSSCCVCPQTATAWPRCSTPASRSPDARSSSPSWIWSGRETVKSLEDWICMLKMYNWQHVNHTFLFRSHP